MSRPAPARRVDRRPADRRGPVRRWFAAGWKRWLLRLTLLALAGAALLVALFAIAYTTVDLPDEPPRAQTSVILDADGNVLAELFDVENRADVRYDEISPIMVEALIAAEDRSFRDHGGLDPAGIARAVWVNVRGGQLQGGSTITQQLVKNTYLTPERSLTRKIREAVLAVKVEEELSKDAILERYLNTVYFGRGAYGIATASAAYFGTTAGELDLAQSALLAGLIRAPEAADPSLDPETARRRRASVLDAMVQTGAATAEDAAAAAASDLGARPRDDARATLRGSTAYFADQVRRWAVATYGEQAAFGGGLRIETTLDPRLQAAAEAAVFDTLDQPGDPDAALVAVDARGAIVAMIGGRSFEESNVNLAVGGAGGGGGRQPGSTFKPFVLAAALDAGIRVTERFPAPASLTVDVRGQPFEVSNFGNEGFGEVDLVTATARSINTVYAQLVAAVGPQAVADAATASGVTADLDPFPAIALGSEEVSPLDMASSYMTYARRGNHVPPFYVERVTEANGAILYTAETEPRRAMAPERADLVNHVLQRVITDGTGTAAAFGRPAAGKTGTTSDNTNAWFVGYTPALGTAVWMGYAEEGRRPMDDVRGRAVTGGGLPAQIWQRFMATAAESIDTGTFTPPRAEDLRDVAPPTTEAEETTTTEEETTTTVEETTTTTEAVETTTTTAPGTTTSAPTTSAPPGNDDGGPSP